MTEDEALEAIKKKVLELADAEMEARQTMGIYDLIKQADTLFAEGTKAEPAVADWYPRSMALEREIHIRQQKVEKALGQYSHDDCQ